MKECTYCRNPVKSHWNFCRRCGARLEHEPEPESIDPIKEEIAVIDPDSPTGVIYESLAKDEPEPEAVKAEEKELTDDELVERIANTIVTREDYSAVLKRKKELDDEISKLLDRVQNKLIPREEALPRIKALKEEVSEVTAKEKSFEDFEAILPMEEIVEDLANEKLKLKKLKSLKGDKAISSSTITDMGKKYNKNIETLKLKLNIELAKMRKTFDAITKRMKSLQKELEVLYIQSQTGEVSDSEYQKQKQAKSKEISGMKKVSNTVAGILAEAK